MTAIFTIFGIVINDLVRNRGDTTPLIAIKSLSKAVARGRTVSILPLFPGYFAHHRTTKAPEIMSAETAAETAKVAILMGSQSDWPIMKRAQAVLGELGVASDARVISAHRKPARLHEFVAEAEASGVQVFIAGAGMAAHLPGVLASLTTKPVLGVPLEAGALKGQDALYAIVQMPGGIPVGTLGIGGAGAKNAGLLAAEILGLSDEALTQRLKDWRAAQAASLEEIPQD